MVPNLRSAGWSVDMRVWKHKLKYVTYYSAVDDKLLAKYFVKHLEFIPTLQERYWALENSSLQCVPMRALERKGEGSPYNANSVITDFAQGLGSTLCWYLRASLVPQTVKDPPANARDLSSIPASGRPPEKGMATHSSVLAWRISWTEEPGGLQSMGSDRVRHDWNTNTLTFKRKILVFGVNLASKILLGDKYYRNPESKNFQWGDGMLRNLPWSSIPWTLFSYEFCFIPQVPLNASSSGRFVCSCGLGQEDGICQMVLYTFQFSFKVLIRV